MFCFVEHLAFCLSFEYPMHIVFRFAVAQCLRGIQSYFSALVTNALEQNSIWSKNRIL